MSGFQQSGFFSGQIYALPHFRSREHGKMCKQCASCLTGGKPPVALDPYPIEQNNQVEIEPTVYAPQTLISTAACTLIKNEMGHLIQKGLENSNTWKNDIKERNDF